MQQPLSRSPATQRLYSELKEKLLALPAGERLGSEANLLVACGASRPTLRHAVALLEREHLIEIRRGNGGGYFVGRPTALAAATAASIYCHAIGITRAEVHSAWLPIRLEAVRLAASNRGELATADLAELIGELRKRPSRHFAKLVRRFNALLTQMTGNRLLSLFLEILYEAGNPIDQLDFYRRQPDRITKYRNQMLRMAEAIADGDVQVAVEAARACFALNEIWLAQDGRKFVGAQSAKESYRSG